MGKEESKEFNKRSQEECGRVGVWAYGRAGVWAAVATQWLNKTAQGFSPGLGFQKRSP
jgi:hypothetical protein